MTDVFYGGGYVWQEVTAVRPGNTFEGELKHQLARMAFETNFVKVAEFMDTFGQEVKDSPELPTEGIAKLRYELIREELEELRQAQEAGDIVAIADALTDLLYVVYGAGHAYGIDLDSTFDEVHNSNMSKVGEDGKPIRREDGKVLKGPNYRAPDLHSVLFPHGVSDE